MTIDTFAKIVRDAQERDRDMKLVEVGYEIDLLRLQKKCGFTAFH